MVTDPDQKRQIVRALRRAQVEQELTCATIAHRSGLASRTVRRLMRGQTFSWETVTVVASVLRVQITLTAFTPRDRVMGEA